jgi:hypothetical protein
MGPAGNGVSRQRADPHPPVWTVRADRDRDHRHLGLQQRIRDLLDPPQAARRPLASTRTWIPAPGASSQSRRLSGSAWSSLMAARSPTTNRTAAPARYHTVTPSRWSRSSGRAAWAAHRTTSSCGGGCRRCRQMGRWSSSASSGRAKSGAASPRVSSLTRRSAVSRCGRTTKAGDSVEWQLGHQIQGPALMRSWLLRRLEAPGCVPCPKRGLRQMSTPRCARRREQLQFRHPQRQADRHCLAPARQSGMPGFFSRRRVLCDLSRSHRRNPVERDAGGPALLPA